MTDTKKKASENQNSNASTTEAEPKIVPKVYDLSKNGDVFSLIRNEEEHIAKQHISAHVNKLVQNLLIGTYKVVFLYDDYNSINQEHSNKLYTALSDLKKTKDILLILVSGGGKIEPAYLISKTCNRLCKDKFVVSVPRKAKSAATLICLGANEIHMGLLSELGPIDPQFAGFPALGLTNALEKISKLANDFPGCSDMFAKYLTDNLNIRHLGYYERINESATQYAERLLDGKTFPNNKSPADLANHFTNHYKDHSFVIDVDESANLLGDIVKVETPEYNLGNVLYEFLEMVDFFARILKDKVIRYVGSIEEGLEFEDKPKSN